MTKSGLGLAPGVREVGLECAAALVDTDPLVVPYQGIGLGVVCRVRARDHHDTVFSVLPTGRGRILTAVRIQFWANERHPVFKTHTTAGDPVGESLDVVDRVVVWPPDHSRAGWSRSLHDSASLQWARLSARLVPRIERFQDYWFELFRAGAAEGLGRAILTGGGVAPHATITPPPGFDGDEWRAGSVMLAIAALGAEVGTFARLSPAQVAIASRAGERVREVICEGFRTDNRLTPWVDPRT